MICSFFYLIKLTCSLFLNFTSSVWPQVLCWFFLWSPLSILSMFLLAFTLHSLHWWIFFAFEWLKEDTWKDNFLVTTIFWALPEPRRNRRHAFLPIVKELPVLWDQDMEMCVPTMESQTRAWSTEGDAFREGLSLLVVSCSPISGEHCIHSSIFPPT